VVYKKPANTGVGSLTVGKSLRGVLPAGGNYGDQPLAVKGINHLPNNIAKIHQKVKPRQSSPGRKFVLTGYALNDKKKKPPKPYRRLSPDMATLLNSPASEIRLERRFPLIPIITQPPKKVTHQNLADPQ
jgi:hypothetical protein